MDEDGPRNFLQMEYYCNIMYLLKIVDTMFLDQTNKQNTWHNVDCFK